MSIASKLSYLLMFIGLLIDGHCAHLVYLTGVTLQPDHPHSDKLVAFYYDMTKAMSIIGNFSYDLRLLEAENRTAVATATAAASRHVKYGGEVGETSPQGVVGHIYQHRADFVVADMEITPERSKFIDFTRPFQRSGLAALIRRTSPVWTKLTALSKDDDGDGGAGGDGGDGGAGEDVVATDDHKHGVVVTLRALLQQSKRAVIEGSFTQRYFRTSKSPRVYHLLPSTVSNYNEALQKLDAVEDFALIGDEDHLALIAANRCDLMVVRATGTDQDIGHDFEQQYAYGLPQKSPYLGSLHGALEELEASGKLDKLKREHWHSRCSQPAVANAAAAAAAAAGEEELMKDDESHELNGPQQRFDISMTSTLTILFISTFWFSLLNCFICP